MKNILYIGSLTIALAAATACSHDELELYHGIDAGIYIQEPAQYMNGNPISYRNKSSVISFTDYGSTTNMVPVFFTVRLMGELKDYDRPYTLIVDTEKSTAVEGEDFDLSGNDFCIKAGEATSQVRVNLLRSTNLRQNELEIYFELKPNEHFIIPFDNYPNSTIWYSTGDTLRSTTWQITYNERYSRPQHWPDDLLGTWSVNKYFEFNRVMDVSINDWKTMYSYGSGSKITAGRLRYFTKEFQTYLQKNADEGTPIIDDDGSYMQLPKEYRVDYSAYGQPI